MAERFARRGAATNAQSLPHVSSVVAPQDIAYCGLYAMLPRVMRYPCGCITFNTSLKRRSLPTQQRSLAASHWHGHHPASSNNSSAINPPHQKTKKKPNRAVHIHWTAAGMLHCPWHCDRVNAGHPCAPHSRHISHQPTAAPPPRSPSRLAPVRRQNNRTAQKPRSLLRPALAAGVRHTCADTSLLIGCTEYSPPLCVAHSQPGGAGSIHICLAADVPPTQHSQHDGIMGCGVPACPPGSLT